MDKKRGESKEVVRKVKEHLRKIKESGTKDAKPNNQQPK